MELGKHFFVGGGIAALAGAVFLIRDHGVPGEAITIIEADGAPGGSLDAAIMDRDSYLVRGARMFEGNFVCTRSLMHAVPSTDCPGQSLYDDFEEFNADHPILHACERLQDGRILERHSAHISRQHGTELLQLILSTEKGLNTRRICDCFERGFFNTQFWLGLSSAFAFQPWHSAVEFRRYVRRFLHFEMPPNKRTKILTTRYNQHDSLIDPIRRYLISQGVTIQTNTVVQSADFGTSQAARRGRPSRWVKALHIQGAAPLHLTADDRVYFTIGSITDGSTRGANGDPPSPQIGATPGWDLWSKLAEAAPGFGRPSVFACAQKLTGWQSFTLTISAGPLAHYLSALRPAGLTPSMVLALMGSPWRASLVPFAQPHFRDQDPQTHIIWGYGLRPDRPGRFCGLPMYEATGTDIITEIAGHLRMDEETAQSVFKDAKVASCRMPMITSQFMPRTKSDRASVRPQGAMNYACMGQFVELPNDTVFTVEYSVRSAWAAVAALNPEGPKPPPVVRSDHNPRVLAYALGHILNVRS